MTAVSEIRKRVKRAMLNVLAIARCCSTVLASEGIDAADDEVALVREELELLRSRLARVPPRRRPYYTPIERMRILELKALRGWNHQEIADRFLVTPATIASWLLRVRRAPPWHVEVLSPRCLSSALG